jgi:hypothetical protein
MRIGHRFGIESQDSISKHAFQSSANWSGRHNAAKTTPAATAKRANTLRCRLNWLSCRVGRDAVAGRQFFKLSIVICYLPRWCECRSQLAQVRRPPILTQCWAMDLRRFSAFELASLGYLFLSQR